MTKVKTRSWMNWVSYALGFIALLGSVLAFLQWQSTTFPNNAFGIDLIYRGAGVLLLLGYLRGPKLWSAYRSEQLAAQSRDKSQNKSASTATPPPLPVKAKLR